MTTRMQDQLPAQNLVETNPIGEEFVEKLWRIFTHLGDITLEIIVGMNIICITIIWKKSQ